MSFFFRAETLYCNAFYAVQDKTNFLSDGDILTFCELLEKDIRESVADNHGCCSVVFNLSEDEKGLFESEANCFARLDDSVVYYGKEIEQDELNRINCCYGSSGITESLSRARESFTRLFASSKESCGSRDVDRTANNLVVV